MSDKQVKTVQQMYQEFAQGNVPGILEHLTDDIEWIQPPGGPEPWAGTSHGKDGVMRFFQALMSTIDVETFEPREFISNGNKVIVLGYYRFRVKPQGPSYETDWVMVWEFKGDKARRFQAFTDSGTEAAAVRIARQQPAYA